MNITRKTKFSQQFPSQYKGVDMTEQIRIKDIEKLVIYPRKVDDSTVKQYAQAMRFGNIFPPIVVAKLSSKIILVDGQARILATKKPFIQAKIIYLNSEDEIYIEAVKLNSLHGKPFTQDERKQIATILSKNMKLDLGLISQIINIPVDELQFVNNIEKILSKSEKTKNKTINKKVFSTLIKYCKKVQELLENHGLDERFASKRIGKNAVIIELKKTRTKIDLILEKIPPQ